MYMEVSDCCGAPLICKIQSDPTNFSDDDYELVVRVWVCSRCGAVMETRRERGGMHDTAESRDTTSGTPEGHHTEST